MAVVIDGALSDIPSDFPIFGTDVGLTEPLVGAFEISPDDDVDLPQVTRQILAGVEGNIAVIWFDGTETIEPVLAGDRLDWRIVRVLETGTTATGLRGYY